MLNITKTMYVKSCIDANKLVIEFFKDNFDGDLFRNYQGYFMVDGKKSGDSTVKLFVTKGRKDRRISFSSWKKFVSIGDTIELAKDSRQRIIVKVIKEED